MAGSTRDTETVEGPSETCLKLSILTLNGGCHTVMATPSWSVHGVKDALTAEIGIAAHQQRLLLASRILSDTEILSEFLSSSIIEHELLLVVCTDALKSELLTSVAIGQLRLSSFERHYTEDADVVRAAVHFDGMQLGSAHGIARKDKSIIDAAVKQNGFALSYAPLEMRKDRDMVLVAVRSNAFAFTLADSDLQNDCDFAIEAVRVNPFVEDWVPSCLRQSAKFCTALDRRTKLPEAVVGTKCDAKLPDITTAASKKTDKKTCCCRLPRLPRLPQIRLLSRKSSACTPQSSGAVMI